ncbi:amidohydrolase family protein [Methylobacterium sp. NEAU 140]|uniref:amidohydrolase family protein n=1 Tax=Methylobacterium sp. NEAU 140 TaxID=3064945 RepID=UPI002735EBD1|nr:amidohydrolase family protein [Methylobacterium sp. NEAU 140]MDP4021912.1 amidohydrolase family protein [Methylobacterium sp. NEAU 140]
MSNNPPDASHASTLQPDGASPKPAPHLPSFALPAGACDSHCHIYGPFDRYPLPADRTVTPDEAPETALHRLHDRLGFARAVIVQSQGYGFDHRLMLDTLAAGHGRYRGVALVRPDTAPADVARHAAAGVCGARFDVMAPLDRRPSDAAIRDAVRLIQPHGWHAQIHVGGTRLVETEGFIRALEVPVVIDHMARHDIAEGPDGPAASAMKRLLDTGRVWLKLSGPERISKTGAPFQDVVPLAAGLARHAPERVLWGSDWPHVNLHGPMPDDGDLIDFIAAAVPDPEARRLLLVDNPARCFGFV